MKKALLVVVAIILLIGGILYTFFSGAKNQETNTPPTQEDIVVTFPVNEDGVDVRQLPSLPVTGTNGEEYKADNFLRNNSVTPDTSNEGSFFLGNTFQTNIADGGPSYVITYTYETDYFNVTLLRAPFATTRTDAELYLKDMLMISEKDMCNLNYTVSVPQYASDMFSGKDLRFSFCEGAFPLN